jgi:uncharacterized protein
MSTALVATSFLMGLAGGPHCVAMCGAACGGITGAASNRTSGASMLFQAGRLSGYMAAGAVAAGAAQGLAWLTSPPALRPVWTFFQLLAFLWGLMLVAQARQPAWLDTAGQAVWQRLRPVAATAGGVFGTGAAWAFMPCGLLYSALLVASLSGGPLDGAMSMAAFAAGGAIWLTGAPVIWRLLRRKGDALRGQTGTRLAGALLAAVSVLALSGGLVKDFAQWCAS